MEDSKKGSSVNKQMLQLLTCKRHTKAAHACLHYMSTFSERWTHRQQPLCLFMSKAH